MSYGQGDFCTLEISKERHLLYLKLRIIKTHEIVIKFIVTGDYEE